MSVHPNDKALAENINNFYTTRLKSRAASGNYEDAVWQTESDAMDMAGMYEKLSKDAEAISKYENDILSNDKILDPNHKQALLEMYKAGIASPEFNPETRTVTPRNVSAPSMAPDVDVSTITNTLSNGWHFDAKSGTRKYTQVSDGTLTDSYGNVIPKGVMAVTTEKGVTKVADEDEIRNTLTESMAAHPGVSAMMDQRLKISLHNNPLQEGETPEDRLANLYESQIAPHINFAAEKHGYRQSESVEAHDMKGLPKGYAGGNGGGGTGTTPGMLPSVDDGKYNLRQAPTKDFTSGPLAVITNAAANPHLATPEQIERARVSSIPILKSIAEKPENQVLLAKAFEEGANNIYGIIKKLETKQPLNSEEGYSLHRLLQGVSNEDMRMASNTVAGLGSDAFTGHLKKHEQNFTDKGTQFTETAALDMEEKQLFGSNKNLAEGNGTVLEMDWRDLETGETTAGHVIMKDPKKYGIAASGKDEKDFYANLKGVVDPTNPGTFHPSYIDSQGKKVEGNFNYLGAPVIQVGQKSFVINNTAAKDRISPSDRAIAYSAFMSRTDSPNEIFVQLKKGDPETKVQVIKDGNGIVTLKAGNKSVKAVTGFDHIPVVREDDGSFRNIMTTNRKDYVGGMSEEKLYKLYPDKKYKGKDIEFIQINPVAEAIQKLIFE
jgi:hypothetical protein